MARERKNRTSLEISRAMLDLARRGVGKTELMYNANLSWELLQKYIAILTGNGMLRAEPAPRNRTRYRTTEKGLRFLNECMRVDELERMRSDSEEKVKRTLAETTYTLDQFKAAFSNYMVEALRCMKSVKDVRPWGRRRPLPAP